MFAYVYSIAIALGIWVLAGPFTLLVIFTPQVATEISLGNIHIFLAVVTVFGLRWPWLWAFVLLTKVTPGVGLVWFAVRREWRSLWIALGVTAAIALPTGLLYPQLWADLIRVLRMPVRMPGISSPYASGLGRRSSRLEPGATGRGSSQSGRCWRSPSCGACTGYRCSSPSCGTCGRRRFHRGDARCPRTARRRRGRGSEQPRMIEASPGRFPNPPAYPRRGRRVVALTIAVLVAVVIRAVLLPAAGLPGDLDAFAQWVGHISNNGLSHAYDEELTFGR